ncbi:MAG: tetratricopeptide repeat protein [Bacteroidetes bacterium]|nr:MAG: tetratricopeptide repeat protein [Bacteroidota bacterium]
MKRFIFILACTVFISQSFLAQDSKVTTGSIALQNSDYKKAFDSFNQALEHPEQLKDKNVPKAYFQRAEARMLYLMDLAKTAQKGVKLTPEQQQVVENGIIDSWQDLKDAQRTDSEGKYEQRITKMRSQLSNQALSMGLNSLNLSYNKNLDPALQKQIRDQARKFLKISEEDNPKNYLVQDLMAQLELSEGDSTKALVLFRKSTKLFKSDPPPMPDFMIGYAFYRTAILERYFQHDIDRTLTSLQEGKVVLQREFDKIQVERASYSDEKWHLLNEEYQNVLADLNAFELDVYLNYPDKRQEALQKFKEAVSKEPKNYTIRVAYASLLEQSGQIEQAIENYQKATELDPKQSMAWFNLGAIHVNQAIQFYQKANGSDDYTAAQSLQKQGDEYYEKAYTPFQKVVELDPCNKEALRALKQICITLSGSKESYNEAYQQYKKQEQECDK